MGMFDYVKCERIMPDGLDGHGILFQTKDTPDQYMHIYTITEQGRLVNDKVHYINTPQEELPYPDAPKDSLLSLCGSMKKIVDIPDVDQNYHGLIEFGYWDDKNNIIHNYIAKFTDGQLIGIITVHPHIDPQKL